MPRPRSVTLLALLVLSLASFNLLSLTSGLRRYTVLRSLPLSLPPAVPIASGALWTAVFGLLAIGLWRLKRWARWGTLAAVTLYLAQVWVELLAFGQSDYIRTTVWFYVVVDGLILLWVWGTLLRPKVQQSFSNSVSNRKSP
jgi:hypothetical protein